MNGILGFGLGLALGGGLVAGQFWHYRRRLRLLGRVLRREASPRALGLRSPLFAVLVDFHDHQETLHRQISHLRSLLTAAPLAYVQVDGDNHLQWYNRAAQELLGLPVGLGDRPRLLLELFRSYDLDQLIETTRASQNPSQRSWSFHGVGTDPSHPIAQPILYLEGYGFPLGRGEVGVFLSDRREVVQLTQQRDRWVSDVAHELKTPLTSIRLVAETLVQRVDPQWRSWMERLLGEVIHLGDLVQDLLDLSHLERRSTPTLVLSSLNLVEVITMAWETLEPLSSRQGLGLDYQGPSALWMRGDRSRLYRVLLNLLDNAIQYSPPQEQITVILREGEERDGEAGWVALEVRDRRSGFPEGALGQVFDRFYRADPSRTRPAGSSSCGLGLAIVRQIVTAHGGRVEARNHPEGGAWLQVALPLAMDPSPKIREG